MNKLFLICLAFIAIQLSFTSAEELKKINMTVTPHIYLHNETMTVGLNTKSVPQLTW